MVSTNWDKFCLLMWKNWRIQMHKKRQFFTIILLSALFCFLLVLIRGVAEPNEFPEKRYTPENIEDLSYLKQTAANPFIKVGIENWEIPYTRQNEFFDKMMEKVAKKLVITAAVPVDNEIELEKYMVNKKAIAGIHFTTNSKTNSIYPEKLTYTVRFPSELRNKTQQIGDLRLTWQTNQQFPRFQIPGPRNREYNHGGIPPGYISEGFLSMQNAIASAYIKTVKEINADATDAATDATDATDSATNNATIAVAVAAAPTSDKDNVNDLPKIQMQRFPYPSSFEDLFILVMEGFFPFLILLAFYYPCKYTLQSITEEKELQLKEVMKIMGLDNYLHWLAWFVKSFILFFFIVGTMILLFKLQLWTLPVLPYSSWSAVLVFFLVYITSTITFLFALSTFFKKADSATAVYGLIMFASYLPYALTYNNETLTLVQMLALSLFTNSGLSFGLRIILRYEGIAEGLQWNNMMTPVNVDDSLHMVHVIIMLLVAAVIHLIIALYIEQIMPGDFGVPQKWYFPFTKEFWCGPKKFVDIDYDNNFNGTTIKVHEPDDFIDKHIGVQVKNLKKVFKNKAAVNGLNLNLYEGEITVLLGHNGAGKTTTISMLTGMIPPTSGTATLNGSDIRKNIKGVRASLGLCPQHNILFNDLTVREHITFYSRLKGLKQKEVNAEIEKYVNKFQLEDKIDTVSYKLSGGMKRKLSVGVAFCGGSKIVLLDEPTAGLDPQARRALWNILQDEKKERTILLTTHLMDEADVLGDRIAIMAAGELKCFGTSFYLKKTFGSGYHLICVKSEKCNSNNVTKVLAKYIPDIKIDREDGAELSYRLSEKYSNVFPQMLSDLEESSNMLNLDGYGISNTTLEEVFMATGSEKRNDEDHINSDDIESLSAYDNNVNDWTPLLKGYKLQYNHWRAMFLKRYLFTIRNIRFFILQNLLPIIFIVLIIYIYKRVTDTTTLQSLHLSLNIFNNPITILETTSDISETSINQKIAEEYKKLFKESSGYGELEETGNNFENYILERQKSHLTQVNKRYMVAATVSKDSIIGWFNNQGYHTAAMSLSLLHNAMVRAILGSSHSIEVTNFPLSFSAETLFERLTHGSNLGFFLAFYLSFCLTFISAIFILFLITERVCKAKLLQFVAGLSVFTFWITTYIWDVLSFAITALIMVLTLLCFQEDGWSTGSELGRLYLVLIIFAICVMPFTYFFSRFFSSPAIAFARISVFYIFSGVGTYLVVMTLSVPELDLKDTADILAWVGVLFPHYSLAQAIDNLNKISQTRKICDYYCDFIPILCTNKEFLCSKFPQCCSTEYFKWEVPGIGRNLIMMATVGIILFLIILIIESRFFTRYATDIFRIFGPKPNEGTDNAEIDDDVQNEKDKVKNLSEDGLAFHNLVLDEVSKYYGSFLAVNQVSVAIAHSECFGLLGINGAGKTSVFKMMTGDENISSGNAYVHGKNLSKEMNAIYKSIGYCPQFNALLEDLTGREIMQFFCLIRGIPESKTKTVINELVEMLGLTKSINKQVKHYSGGNKRKLSTAVALLGGPQVVYLDEPTAGIDPEARRHIWNAITRFRNNGKSIVLTSHSMEECEALCNRLTVMVNGKFKCIGSMQHLKNKFSKGIVLIIKLKNKHKEELEKSNGIIEVSAENLSQNVGSLTRFLQTHFPQTTLMEQYRLMLTYTIPRTSDIKWSQIFGILEKNKNDLNIEAYSLSQATLEQIFLDLVKYQREEISNRKKKRCCM